MKLVTAVIKPYQLDAVKEALHALGVAGLTVSEDAEVGGIDIADHGETAYDFTPSGGSGGGAFSMAGITPTVNADGKADVDQKVAG